MAGLIHIGLAGARGRMGRAVSDVLDTRKDVVVAFGGGSPMDVQRVDPASAAAGSAAAVGRGNTKASVASAASDMAS